MAPRDPNTVRDTVTESLGLTADDLGMNRSDPFEGMDFGNEEGDGTGEDIGAGDFTDQDIEVRGEQRERRVEDGDDDEPRQPQRKDKKEPDDLRVTHTPEQNGRPLPQNAEVRPDKHGNLVNKEGKLVAKAGREARFYQSWQKAEGKAQQLVTQANIRIQDGEKKLNKAVEIGMRLSDQLTAVREAGTAHTRAGLNDQEHNQAIELAVMAKKEPIQALKTLLTRAAASGIDLTQLGLQPGGFDTKALLDMVRGEIQTHVAPLKQRTEQEQTAERNRLENQRKSEEATTELQTFVADNPEVKPFLPAFAKIYADPELQHMSLGEVWARMQTNLLRRGIDPKNPQRQQRSPNPQRQQRRLPNGRGTPPGTRDGRRVDRSEMAPVSSSYDDILNDVLS